MKRVVIGMKDGKPYVISKQGKVEVVIRIEKPKTIRKRVRTLLFRIRSVFSSKIAG
ncbi:hypothetical protein [Cohnella yongneupensis]|uniref:Uncharacterized protein n=1 Tax=Cohnella yongneupensis TaxID=425006 RepID=A0ABW0QU07_9BACL